MPDLSAPDAATGLLDTVKTLVAEVVAPHAAAVDAEARFPKEAVAALGKAGLLGLQVDPALGGKGLGPRAFAAVTEELATACGSTAMVYVMHVTALQAIASSTTLYARDEILKSAAAGRHLTTLAFSERGSRSQFWAPVSRLVPEGDGFVTAATKSWITSANHADSYVASAQAPARLRRWSRPSTWPAAAPGVKISGRFDGLGLRGNDSAPVEFQDVRVEAKDLLSAQGEGANTMLGVVLPWFCIGTAAMANGFPARQSRSRRAISPARGSSTRAPRCATCRAPRAHATMSAAPSRRALLATTLGELENPTESTPLFVLQTRLAALEAARDVTDLAMKAAAARRSRGSSARARVPRRAGGLGHGADRRSPARAHRPGLTGLPLF